MAIAVQFLTMEFNPAHKSNESSPRDSVLIAHSLRRAGAGARLPNGCADTTSHEVVYSRGTKDGCL
jgi:hypothetical protein